MNILDKITEQRLARGWTEYQLSVRSGVPQSTISSWYRKDMLPSLTSLEKICMAFGITLSQFFSESALRELTPKQLDLLEHWEQLPTSQQDAVIALIHSILKP